MKTKRLKFLIVSQYFYPESFRINDLAEELIHRGHEVDVLTGLPNYPQGRFFDGYSLRGPYQEELLGAKVFRVPLWPRSHGSAVNLSLNYLSFAITGSLFAQFRLPGRYDHCVVFATSPITAALPAIAYCRPRGIPVHIWIQDLWPESLEAVGMVKTKSLLKAVGQLVRFIYSNSRTVYIQSKSFKESVLKWGARPEQVKFLPNWGDEPVHLKKTPPKDLPTGFNCTFAGNLGKAQGLTTVLEAAQQTLKEEPSIQWVLIGEGSEKTALIEQAKRLNLTNVHFLGRKDPTEMPAYFSASDCLLVTLRNEHVLNLTIPSKVQTYLANGRPIVGALNGAGARLIVEAEAGLVGPAEAGPALAENVKKIYKMSELERERLAASALRHFSEFYTKEKVVAQLLNDMN